MKYELIVSGEFSNVQGLQADLTFPAVITCSLCNYTHPKTVIITEDSSVKLKFNYKCNFELQCHSCKNDIKISILKPENMVCEEIPDKYDDLFKIEYCPVTNDLCKLSIFNSQGGEISEIKNTPLNVLTSDKKFFKNQVIDEKKSLVGDYGEGKFFSILNCEFFIKQIK
ncbi:hypothetical protein NAPIS_ORF00410 [Vairimorpha apis BRL 01]|uniref:Uncharacterized protein n=1 Tax=Vairimorpha apis BRL 01 TaxID=1037528 RepID=T0LCI4_9MICR|nr:hypothetical protein NAPIS_ORF00410 [Vairimorpha apis BRL 01]